MPLRKDISKVLVIGSGPIVIGQAAEFDYAGTQACFALKEEQIEVVLVNNNPATIMTDQSVADKVYVEPLTVPSIEEIVAKERPDGILGTLGGQTGLNLTIELAKGGILNNYDVEVLGSSVEAIKQGEDRELFRSLMLKIGEPVLESQIFNSYEAALVFVEQVGLPVIIRPAYTLGGSGGGLACSKDELRAVVEQGLAESPIDQVLVEVGIHGFKEIEYEVIRDRNDTCIIVCSMENMEPVGIHTGDSIVVAPTQTLTNKQNQMLRQASLKIVHALDIVGACNIQFALDPQSNDYYIIEVNPRVSRSSALASKATGYPIARIATKCAIGYHLEEIQNPITGTTPASFEPAIDYVVVKLPRFPFDKFTEADRLLGTQMKATGEVMAIDRSFAASLNKGVRSLEMVVTGLRLKALSSYSEEQLRQMLTKPVDIGLFVIAEAIHRGLSVEEIYSLTKIDPWFLENIKMLVDLEIELLSYSWNVLPDQLLKLAKRYNIGDKHLAEIFNVSESEVRNRRNQLGICPGYKLVDTCAGEYDATAPYYYSTWQGKDESEVYDGRKMLVIGSGPIRIGQGIEFDYCSVQAALALKNQGYKAIVVNNNPETVSTDYSIADRLYFEPLTVEDILNVAEKEQVEGVLVQFGGQTAINLAKGLQDAGLKILGTKIDNIDQLEDRQRFYQLLNNLQIPHIAGSSVTSSKELITTADRLGYPILVRPSYVIGGQAMFIFYGQDELLEYASQLKQDEQQQIWPVLVDKYVPGLECEVDVVADGKNMIIPGIFEHIEKAGVHSGDSIAILPAVSLSQEIQATIVDYVNKIVTSVPIVGIMNIQFVVSGQTVYVLEVNPRASRTVPIVSKVTQVSMVELAAMVQLGLALEDLQASLGLIAPPRYYAVKVPVFSTPKLNQVDLALGPEMKSTGEILALGKTLAESLRKAVDQTTLHTLHTWDHDPNQRQYILVSIADREKQAALPLMYELVKRGCKLLATEGTARFLAEHNIFAEQLIKDKQTAVNLFGNDMIKAFINIPSRGRIKDRFGFFLRAQTVVHQVPCYTCLDTLNMILNLSNDTKTVIRSLESYQQL